MLTNYDKTEILDNQAYVKKEKHTFGVFLEDANHQKVFNKHIVENIYIHYYYNSSMDIYYNNVLIKSFGSDYYDYYHLGSCLKDVQFDIDNFVKIFNIEDSSKLELRISLFRTREVYQYVNDKFISVPKEWFFNFKDSEYYYGLDFDKRFDDSLNKNLDLSSGVLEEKPSVIHSTISDGFTFDFSKMKSFFLKEIEKHNYIIKDNTFIENF